MKQRSSLQASRHPLSTAIAGALVSLSLAGSGSAFAADQEADEKQDKKLDSLVVVGSYTTEQLDTGTGLGLSLQETPQSVSIMTAQRMADQGLDNLNDVVRNIQGISSKGRDTERNAFASRGFDINDIQIDGIPIPGHFNSETMVSTGPYERVEVVRGATGLLTGTGDPGASINLVRKHADSDVLTGTLSATAGRWNYYGTSLDLTTPFNDAATVRGRFVADYDQSDSHIDNYSKENSSLYGVIDADISDSTSLSMGVSYQQRSPKGSTWSGLPVWFADGSRTDWERSRTTGADWTGIESRHTSYFANLSHEFANNWTAELNLNRFEQHSDWKVLWWWTPIDKDTGAGSEAGPRQFDSANDVNAIDAKLSGFYSAFGREHELMFGARYSEAKQTWYRQETDQGWFPIDNYYTWDGSQLPEPEWDAGELKQDSKLTENGFFAATRLNASDDLKVILGGRLSNWKARGMSFGLPLNVEEKNVFTPYAGALYDLNDQHRVYASYTEIFRPQPDEYDRNAQMLDPLEGKSYEAGLKSRFFNNKLQTTFTLFRIEQDNLAQQDIGHNIPGTDVVASRAAQGTESDGFEFEVVGELSPGWDLHFSYTDFDAKEGAQNSAADSNPTGDVNTHQPRQLLKLFTTYNLPGDWNKLTVGGGVNWEASNYTLTTNEWTDAPEKLKQKSFYLVNLMARYDFTPQLSAQLNVDNLFDETYYDQIGFYKHYSYGEPRNVRLKVNYNF